MFDANARINWCPGPWVPGDGRGLRVKCSFKNDIPLSNLGQAPAGPGTKFVETPAQVPAPACRESQCNPGSFSVHFPARMRERASHSSCIIKSWCLVCCGVSIWEKKKTVYRISFIKKKIAKIDKVKTTTVASHRVEFCKKSAGNRKDDFLTSFTPTNIVVVGQRNAIFICIFRTKIEGNYLSSSHFKSCRRTTYPLATSRDFKSKICDLHI